MSSVSSSQANFRREHCRIIRRSKEKGAREELAEKSGILAVRLSECFLHRILNVWVQYMPDLTNSLRLAEVGN